MRYLRKLYRNPERGSHRGERDLHEFMPAALEITESPPLPKARAITWTIMIFFVALVIWATFGKVDIVVVAQGKVIPAGHVKVIEPLETGVVTALHVMEGQFVKAGDVLITLDSTVVAADLAQIDAEMTAIDSDLKRLKRLRSSLLSGEMARNSLEDKSASNGTYRQISGELFQAELREHLSQRSSLDADISRTQAVQQTLRGEIAKLDELLPITRQRVENLGKLATDNLVPRQQYLDAKQELIVQEGELSSAQSRLHEVQAETLSLRESRNALLAETERKLLEREQELMRRLEELTLEQEKAKQRYSLQTLRAPVDGYVKQLVVHTLGDVVKTGEEIMQIVPSTKRLTIEALVLNKDVGFIQTGQKVSIKIDAFPFTRYGIIDGLLEGVSADSVFQENIGLVYKARVSGDLDSAPPSIRLVPGMTATVEVKTGSRRIIELFLSPLLKYKQESLRER